MSFTFLFAPSQLTAIVQYRVESESSGSRRSRILKDRVACQGDEVREKCFRQVISIVEGAEKGTLVDGYVGKERYL